MTRNRIRERSSETEGSDVSCGHRKKRSHSERPSGRHSRNCGLSEDVEAEPAAGPGAGRMQPYVIRGGRRVLCRCGKRDGLQDDIPPPRKKGDVLRAPPDDVQRTLLTCADAVRLPVENPPQLPIEDPHLPPAGGPPLLPDVCPLCRSQTYNLPNLPNLLGMQGVREPARLALEARPSTPPPGQAACTVAVVPVGDALGQLPSAAGLGPGQGMLCRYPRPWGHPTPQAGAGSLCQCGRTLDDGGREVQGHARRLQCCGETAAKIAERIEKSLQAATAHAAKSNAIEHLRRSQSRGEVAAREAAKRSASVPQQLNRNREGCLTMVQEPKQTPATYDTPVYAATTQNVQTTWPVIKQHSSSFTKHGSREVNCSKHALQTQSSLERSQERHHRTTCTPACTGAGDKSSSPGNQYKYNWWCMSQPGARIAFQNNSKGDPRQIGAEPEALMPAYSIVCPHHPQWHSICKCVHRIPFVLQTPVTSDDSKEIIETEDGNSTISPCGIQGLYNDGAKSLTETSNCTSVNLQEPFINAEETSNISKDRGKLETTKKASCCQATEMATQTLVSCVKSPLSSECNDKTIFASRGILYRKVDDSLQPINRLKKESGTQTVLTVARITPSSSLEISRTASKGTVCGSFVRTIGPNNSVQPTSGLQSICPIVRKLIPSRAESVKSTASKGTICRRSERVILPTRPEGREIAIQAGETILTQLRASKSLENMNSVHRPISRPRTLSSSSTSPCSSVADTIATHQSGTTLPLLSCPEDMLGLPYFSWPSLKATTTCKTLRDKECDLQHERDVVDLDDDEECTADRTLLAPSSVECRTRASGKRDEEMKRKISTATTNIQPHDHQTVEGDEPSKQHISGCGGRATLPTNRRENGCATFVGKVLQPKCLNAGNEGQAQIAKAAGPLRRPPAKRPLEIYVPTPQGQYGQRGTKQMLKQTQRNQPCENSKSNI